MRLKGDRVVVPPRSHSRVQVYCEGYCGIDEELEINVIAPRGESKKWRSGLRAAWGVCVKPEWIQVANFTNEPKVLLPGATLAELHTIVGLGRRLATDPELEELELEQKEREGRRRVELERLEKRLFALQVKAPTTANQGLRGDSAEGMATPQTPGGDVRAVHSEGAHVRLGKGPPYGPMCKTKRLRERNTHIDHSTQGGFTTPTPYIEKLTESRRGEVAGASAPQDARTDHRDAVMPDVLGDAKEGRAPVLKKRSRVEGKENDRVEELLKLVEPLKVDY